MLAYDETQIRPSLRFCNTLVPLKQHTEQILLSQQATNALTEPLLQIFMVISLVKKQEAF